MLKNDFPSAIYWNLKQLFVVFQYTSIIECYCWLIKPQQREHVNTVMESKFFSGDVFKDKHHFTVLGWRKIPWTTAYIRNQSFFLGSFSGTEWEKCFTGSHSPFHSAEKLITYALDPPNTSLPIAECVEPLSHLRGPGKASCLSPLPAGKSACTSSKPLGSELYALINILLITKAAVILWWNGLHKMKTTSGVLETCLALVNH